MKKLFSLLLIVILALVNTNPVIAASFSDVSESHEFYKHIETLKADKIIHGYEDGTFRPDQPLTRGQLAKFIAKSLQIDINTQCTNFDDIDPTNTFFTYITSLKCHGIISGFSDNTYRADENVNRGEATKFIISAARFVKNNQSYLEGIYNTVFSDVPANHTFAKYIDAAYTHSLVRGYSNGQFKPNYQISRGEIAKIIDEARSIIPLTNKCIYYGKEYNQGSTFNSADNCNKCACVRGQVQCTFSICVDTLDYTLTLKNYAYTPNLLKAKPGQRLNIKLVNQYGYHNFVIDELNVVSQSISTGEETIVQIQIPDNTAGKEYQFYCSNSDHRTKGMVGIIKVEE
jgi:plastocyanin